MLALKRSLLSQSQSYFMTSGLPSISSPKWQAPWDSRPLIFFNWTLAVIVLTWHPLWQEDASLIYNFCWFSPVKSFSGSSPARLMTIFYCLRFETPPTRRARSLYLYFPKTGWPGYTLRHWVPFSSPPMALRATVEVFEPASTHTDYSLLVSSRFSLYSLCTDREEIITSNEPSIVAWLFITA
jgi:hypothetical protein